MKNFLDLLDTKLHLDVVINGDCRCVRLHDELLFDANASVSIDGIEILPRYQHLAENSVLTIAEPFYCWYHRVSGQGWLLTPTQ
jgi:hypothetical protein